MKARARKTFRLSIIALALMGGAGAQAATVTTGSMNQSTATDNTNNSTYGSAQTANSTFTLPQYLGGNVLTGVTFSAASSASASVFDNTSSAFSTGIARLSGSYSAAGATASGQGDTSVESQSGTNSNTYTLSYSTNTATVTSGNLGSFLTGNVSGTVSESVAVNKCH